MHSCGSQKTKNMTQRYFIGIDVSKAKLDCAVILPDYTVLVEKVVLNKDRNIATFLKALMRKTRSNASDLLVCCESTGIYNRPLERICHELEIPLWVEQAIKIKRASTDLRGKSDRKDALRIAEYSVRYEDRKVLNEPCSESVQEMNTLSKARESLLVQKVALENQLREAQSHDPHLFKQLKALYNSTLKTLGKELHKIEMLMQEVIEKNPEIKTNIELIQSIPGVGRQTAQQFVIHTNNFHFFKSAKHLACYAGVVPFANESGTIIKQSRVSKLANMKLKMILHLAAMSAIRTTSELKSYFIRKVSEGKNKMLVLNAVRNKLVHRIWAVVQRQTPFIHHTEFLSIEKFA